MTKKDTTCYFRHMEKSPASNWDANALQTALIAYLCQYTFCQSTYQVYREFDLNIA